jgi:hypothetical protein
MPNDLTFLLRDIVDPGTWPGAVSYGVIFVFVAWLAGRAVRLAVHRALGGHVPRADPTAVKFLGQLARLSIYVVALLSFVYEIPVLRQLGGVWLTSVGVVSVIVVNGGAKVRRVAEEKCSARPINTPHTVGRQLFNHSCCNTLDVGLSALAPN